MGAVSTQPLPEFIGRYELLGRLALGGMAEILLARLRGPSGFERPVVIKRILPHYADVSAFVDMFLDEARLAARIAHPNVVHVHELGRTASDLYIAMEYLEGESVAGLMRRAVARAMGLPPFVAAHIAAQACAGLHAAHELRDGQGNPQNLVHRDVSPQNLVVTYDGTVKILDFGIAKAADRISKTEAGVLKGKFDYMSPEQAEGMPLDRRSDVFSLGIVLYEISTGHRLFKRETTTATIRAVTNAYVRPPSEIVPDYPPVLERICLRALERHPDDRYPTAADMRRDLVSGLPAMNSDPLPEEALSRLMHELFPDRIEEKRKMLEHVREGSKILHVPAAEADSEVELPMAETALAEATRTIADPPAPARRTGLVIAAAAVALAAGAVLALLASSDPAPPAARDAPPPARVLQKGHAPTQHDPPAIEATPSAPSEITLRIDTTPEGAEVTIDGEPRGRTPLALSVPRGDEAITLVLSREGYEEESRTVTPTESQLLTLELTELPRRLRDRRRRVPRGSDMDRSFRRFD